MKEMSCFPGFNKMRTNWPAKPVRDEMVAGVSSRIGGARGKAKDDPSARFFEVHADNSDEHVTSFPPITAEYDDEARRAALRKWRSR